MCWCVLCVRRKINKRGEESPKLWTFSHQNFFLLWLLRLTAPSFKTEIFDHKQSDTGTTFFSYNLTFLKDDESLRTKKIVLA